MGLFVEGLGADRNRYVYVSANFMNLKQLSHYAIDFTHGTPLCSSFVELPYAASCPLMDLMQFSIGKSS